ncbi:hypothetical protein C8J57DRAFT_1725466 [Mycena rebaudengoi]|nr:hypothetical protein C8J57DRAFT_1725466 [Mycena rebaudengoi]
MAPLTTTQLFIIEVFTEAFFYGLHWAVFLVFLGIWTRRKINPILVGVTVLMFLLATAHMALVLWQNLATVPSKISVPLQKNLQARVILAFTHIMLGEGILIWRAWAVWGRDYRVIVVPVILMAMAYSFGMYTAASTAKTSVVINLVSPSLWLANCILCTSLIAGRILYINSFMRSAGQSSTLAGRYLGTILLVGESGAIYTAAQIASLVLQKMNHPGLHVILDLDIPLFGILPTIIIVLVQLQLVPLTRSTTSHLSTSIPMPITWKAADRNDSNLKTNGSTTIASDF